MDQGKKDETLGILQQLSKEFNVIVQLFDVLSRTPDVVTPELLKKAKMKMQNICQKVKQVENNLTAQERQELNEAGNGTLSPVMLLDEVLAEFEEQLDVSLALSNDEIGLVRMSDEEFVTVIRSLLDNSIQSQVGINRKSCEISLGSDRQHLVIKFKDFARSIPESDLPGFFDGDQGAGYGMYRLAKRLQNAGGQVKVESGQARCTVFTLKIPYAA